MPTPETNANVQPAPQESTQELETAFLVCIPKKGGSPFATAGVKGIPMVREATLADIYSAVISVAKDVEAIELAVRIKEAQEFGKGLKMADLSKFSPEQRQALINQFTQK